MEMLVGVAWRASQCGEQPLARGMPGCVLIDAANEDLGYLDFSRNGTCEWRENIPKWRAVWNLLRKLGLEP